MGIKLFGKNILQVYRHRIMRIDYKTVVKDASSIRKCSFRRIKKSSIARDMEAVGSTITTANLERLVKTNPHLCEGFILYDPGNTPIGSIWVMYRGGNDLEYRIRNTDAYIYGVYIRPEYRGNGWAGVMISRLMRYLHIRKRIDCAVLAVSRKNASAIRAYRKAGFADIGDKEFIRFMKINIPYHVL